MFPYYAFFPQLFPVTVVLCQESPSWSSFPDTGTAAHALATTGGYDLKAFTISSVVADKTWNMSNTSKPSMCASYNPGDASEPGPLLDRVEVSASELNASYVSTEAHLVEGTYIHILPSGGCVVEGRCVGQSFPFRFRNI